MTTDIRFSGSKRLPVIYQFAKEIVNNYLIKGHGYITGCTVYKVFQDKRIIGTLFLHNLLRYFTYAGHEVLIDRKNGLLTPGKYILTDQKDRSKLGECRISRYWLLSNVVGKLILAGHEPFTCNKLKPDISYSVFDKNTWGHYKVQVSNGLQAVVYRLKMDQSIVNSNDARLKAFTGEIELSGDNMPLLFAGLLLLEQVFENEDNAD